MVNTSATVPSDAVYDDQAVRLFSIAAVVWGVVGMLVGVYIAAELAFPDINFGIPWLSYGRLRPLHTNAVIFAFGGCALMATSYYVVQRTCQVRLLSSRLAALHFWGYQAVIVLAAITLPLGITRGKIQLQRRPVDLASVVARAVETSRPLVDERRHQMFGVLRIEQGEDIGVGRIEGLGRIAGEREEFLAPGRPAVAAAIVPPPHAPQPMRLGQRFRPPGRDRDGLGEAVRPRRPGDRGADEADADQRQFLEHQSLAPLAPKSLSTSTTPRIPASSPIEMRSACGMP